MDRQKSLKVWLGRDESDSVLLPTQAEVLYAEPNPDNTRKACRNCVLYMADMSQCAIHDSSIPVGLDMICGYHVFGTPGAVQLDRTNLDPVLPAFSGLERVKRGTSCDTCANYTVTGQTIGTCRAVRGDKDPNAQVDALGCCTRWTPGRV